MIELKRKDLGINLLNVKRGIEVLKRNSIIEIVSTKSSLPGNGGGPIIPADALLYDDGSQVFYTDGIYVKKNTPPQIIFRNFADTIDSYIQNDDVVSKERTFPDANGSILDIPNFYIRGVTADKYYDLGCDYGAGTATAAPPINTIRLNQWDCRCKVTIDTLQYEVTTGTSGNLRFAIYADNGFGYPGALIYQTPNQVISAAQIYQVTGLNIQLDPGTYWIGYITDTANTLRGRLGTTGWYNVGHPSTITSTVQNTYSLAQTYGAFPDPFTAGASMAQNSHVLLYARFI